MSYPFDPSLPISNKERIDGLIRDQGKVESRIGAVEDKVDVVEDNYTVLHNDVKNVKTWAKVIAGGVWALFIAGLPVIIDLLTQG